jgi:glycosyltransferase involved in cell wall biosynthesis
MGCYNEDQYLDETIPALLAQTMPDIGILLVNNGSTDDSAIMIRDYRDRDRRIVLLELPRNLPPPHVANIGMSVALRMWQDCAWFLAQGADDVMAGEYVEAVLDAAGGHPDANLVFSPWRWLSHPEKGVQRFPAFDAERCHATHMIPAWHACRRDLWDAIGGHDESVPIASDWDWVVRARYQLRPVQLDRPYNGLRVRNGRKSQSDEVHWPTLHRHLCEVANKPVPSWAAC